MLLEKIKATAAHLAAVTNNFCPEVGIILGTGLGDFGEKIEAAHILDYASIPGFPVSTVEGHK